MKFSVGMLAVPSWMEPHHRVSFHRIPWEGGANYERRYEDDEGVHNGTWTFKKIISPQHGKWTGVSAVLHITSNMFGAVGAKRKATHYVLGVKLAQVTCNICTARCVSVRDAKDHADRINLSYALHNLLRKIYNKNRARCVFSADGTPLLSTFDDLYGWRDGLPCGHYYDIDPVEHFRERSIHHTNVFGCGYSAGGIPSTDVTLAFASTLKPWT